MEACVCTNLQAPSSRWKTALQRGDTCLPSGSVIVTCVVAQPTVPSLNASTSRGENAAFPPAPSTSPRRNRATELPPLNTSTGSLPIRRVNSDGETCASTSEASPREAASNQATTSCSSSGDLSTLSLLASGSYAYPTASDMSRRRPANRLPRMSRHKIILDEDSLPTHWYNLGADLPLPAPPLHPGTHQPRRARGSGAALPDVDHLAGGLGRGRARDPRRGARGLPHLAARRRSCAPIASSARSGSRACASTTSTRAAARPARTSPTRPCRRRSTARRTGASASRRRPAPASGDRRCPMRRSSTGSSARSSWWASRTGRSPTGAS